MGTLGKRPVPGEPRSEPRKAKPNGDTNRSLIDIEIALAKEFDWVRNLVVFNVLGTSGVLNIQHECDMLICTKAGYLTEVEIKRTYEDFCADFDKKHHHESHGAGIREFWYCIPVGIFKKCHERLERAKRLPTGFICYDEDLNFSRRVVMCATNDDDMRRTFDQNYLNHCRYVLRFRDDDPQVVLLFNGNARPLFLEQRLDLARLGAMRQVSLRERIVKVEAASANPDAKLRRRIEEQEILLDEYRRRFEEVAGYKLDEKEALYDKVAE